MLQSIIPLPLNSLISRSQGSFRYLFHLPSRAWNHIVEFRPTITRGVELFTDTSSSTRSL